MLNIKGCWGILSPCYEKWMKKIPLTLLSDGYISELFTGRISVKVGNYKSEKIKLSCRTEIAYI